MSKTKKCSKCKQRKGLSAFFKDNTYADGFYPICKVCFKKQCKKDLSINKTDLHKDVELASKARERSWLNQGINLTWEGYLTMLQRQDNKCAICKIPAKGLKKALAVDHDHATGKIRGLLCNSCNQMLGKAKDNLTILQNAIEYLGDWKLPFE